MSKPIRIKEEWIFCGLRADRKTGKLSVTWLDTGCSYRFYQKKKGYRPFKIGSVYTIERAKDYALYHSPFPQPTGIQADGDQINLWTSMHDEALEFHRLTSQRCKDSKKADPLDEHLEYIRSRYRKTSSEGRRNLIAHILEFISR